MKLEQGDAFEAGKADWIRARLPHYEPVWAAFIGHNGNGGPLPMAGLTPEQDLARKRFYQAHYSFALYAEEFDSLLQHVGRNAGAVATFDAFNHEQRLLQHAVTLVGQVRDMFKIIDDSLKMGGSLVNPMQALYDLRSHVMHGPRMPARLEDGFLKIPRIATRNPAIGEWDDKSVWDDFSGSQFVFFADFCDSLSGDFFTLLGDQHPKTFPAADQRFGGRRVEDPAKIQILDYASLSGLGAFPAISAYFPPASGVR